MRACGVGLCCLEDDVNQDEFESTVMAELEEIEWERREKRRIQQLEQLAESAQSRDDE